MHHPLLFVAILSIFVLVCCVLPVIHVVHHPGLSWGIVVGLFVISISIAPYEQWLAGRMVVLSDMALIVVQEQNPFPPCEQRLAAAMWAGGSSQG